MKLEKILDKLAGDLEKKASATDTSLQESTDAFKALVQYFAILQKHKKSDEDEDDGANFASFTAGINGLTEEPGNDGTAVSRRRRNS